MNSAGFTYIYICILFVHYCVNDLGNKCVGILFMHTSVRVYEYVQSPARGVQTRQR